MKRIGIICVAILGVLAFKGYGQSKEEPAGKIKPDQRELVNDVFLSYGTGTLYYFVENDGMKATSMSGTFLAGYSRSVSDIIAVGFQLSYTMIDRKETYYYYPDTLNYYNTQTNNLWQGIATVRFRYVNSPSFCMYSGVGMGVTMNYKQTTYANGTPSEKEQQILPAGQLTLLGFRVGRTISFFGEFGLGTNSILSAGVSYKFKD